MTIRELFTAIGDGFQDIGQFAHDAGQWFLDIDLMDLVWTGVWIGGPLLLISAFCWFIGEAVQINERRKIEHHQRQLEEEWGRLP